MDKHKTHTYDDIIDLPHHVSAKHPPMSRRDRAAQFAPFAALTGHGAALGETARLTEEPIELDEDMRAELDMKQRMLLEALPSRPQVTVTFFREDPFKHGGVYLTLTDTVAAIEELERVIVMAGGERIPFDYVIALESELFSGAF